jgi:magnesium-transporting ATPase (P-type)
MMTNEDRQDFALANQFASKGLRTLAFGYKEIVEPSN